MDARRDLLNEFNQYQGTDAHNKMRLYLKQLIEDTRCRFDEAAPEEMAKLQGEVRGYKKLLRDITPRELVEHKEGAYTP